jgi:hypothetical protein
MYVSRSILLFRSDDPWTKGASSQLTDRWNRTVALLPAISECDSPAGTAVPALKGWCVNFWTIVFVSRRKVLHS